VLLGGQAGELVSDLIGSDPGVCGHSSKLDIYPILPSRALDFYNNPFQADLSTLLVWPRQRFQHRLVGKSTLLATCFCHCCNKS